MAWIDYRTRYVEFVRELTTRFDHDQAMRSASGGQYELMGAIMRELLIAAGLLPHHSLVDVGCGSGRLAFALRSYLHGPYLGVDVVPDLLAYAREACQRPDWRFEEASGTSIPAGDGTADMVCFFSVMTHLLHEDSYRYLAEAARVLKEDGTIVFSFLDFSVAGHWPVFEGMLDARARGEDTHHNQFMARGMIEPWAARLGLSVAAVLDGDTPQVRLAADVKTEDGSVVPRETGLGQSICILRKGYMAAGKSEPDGAARASIVASANAPVVDEAARQQLRLLEARITQAEDNVSRLTTDVGAILATRSWRAIRRIRSWVGRTP